MKFSKLFVAISVPPAHVRTLEKLRKSFSSDKNGIRWTETEQYHITIKFLGDIENREIPAVCTHLSQACEGLPGFSVQVQGLGTFPKNKPPRVLWAGIQDGLDSLATLHTKLDASLLELGVASEGRAYNPHLTLARIGKQANETSVASLIEHHNEKINFRFETDEVLLLESERVGKRYEYHVVDRVGLR